jgi:hypothetical protein
MSNRPQSAGHPIDRRRSASESDCRAGSRPCDRALRSVRPPLRVCSTDSFWNRRSPSQARTTTRNPPLSGQTTRRNPTMSEDKHIHPRSQGARQKTVPIRQVTVIGLPKSYRPIHCKMRSRTRQRISARAPGSLAALRLYPAQSRHALQVRLSEQQCSGLTIDGETHRVNGGPFARYERRSIGRCHQRLHHARSRVEL